MLKQRLDYIYVIEKMSNWHKKEVTKGLLRFFFFLNWLEAQGDALGGDLGLPMWPESQYSQN